MVVVESGYIIPRCIIKDIPNLKVIYGSNLDISGIAPGSFLNLPKLEIINLSHNFISVIYYGTFINLSSVQVLDLSWNEIVYIEKDSLIDMVNLKKLDLSRNLLTQFDGVNYFAGGNDYKLEELNLSHNQLAYVEGLGLLSELSSLDLSHNYIANINNLSIPDFMKKVDVRDNNLESLIIMKFYGYIDELKISFNLLNKPSDLFITTRVNFISLDGNPWQCNLYMDIFQRTVYSNVTILDYNTDEEIYFLNKWERENFPTCTAIPEFTAKDNPFSSLKEAYKTKKNPACSSNHDCPDHMTCKGGRCWDPCKYNVCHKSSKCVTRNHKHECTCLTGIKKPFSTDTKCYNVECFQDSDCSAVGYQRHVCDMKKHACKLAKP